MTSVKKCAESPSPKAQAESPQPSPLTAEQLENLYLGWDLCMKDECETPLKDRELNLLILC